MDSDASKVPNRGIDMLLDTHVDMCTNMCIDMRTDMCVGMPTDLCNACAMYHLKSSR